MKKIFFLQLFILVFVFAGYSQIIPSDITNPITSLKFEPGQNKFIEWPTSGYGNGFGHRIINSDPGSSTFLHFQSRHNSVNWSSSMSISSQGLVGIGTTTPGAKLHVNGEAIFKPDFVNHNFIKISSNSTNQTNLTFISQNTAKWNLYSNDESFHFRKAGSNAAEVMVLDSNGNVGIGTTSPSEKLTVKGKILCSEVEVVDVSTIPDYVFQKYYTGESSLKEDYVMPTLEEIEAFTKANHHLPEVPSAAEIKEEGLQLKEMTTILLQKVEELTLYTIEQEKRIKELEAILAEKE